MQINCYKDFCDELLRCGFSLGGGNAKGIFALIPYSWENQDSVDSPVRWHTGNPDTDPWEWRMRVLEERTDIAYAKVFFGGAGYITKEWYPYFFAARRNKESFDDAYRSGIVSQIVRRVFDTVRENGYIPYHELRALGGFSKEEQPAFERAVVELQKRMFLTLAGRMKKRNKSGETYGWSSTVFCTVEQFWDCDLLSETASLSQEEAVGKITEQVLRLNPAADPKKIKRFIFG